MIAAVHLLFRPDREGLRLWTSERGKPTADAVPQSPSRARRIACRRWSLCAPTLPRAGRNSSSSRGSIRRGVLGGVRVPGDARVRPVQSRAALPWLDNEMFGTKCYPVTHLMNETMDGSYNFLLY